MFLQLISSHCFSGYDSLHLSISAHLLYITLGSDVIYSHSTVQIVAILIQNHSADNGDLFPQGAPGIFGLPGPPGERGGSGSDGVNGANGQDGSAGVPGRDGSPGTPGLPVRYMPET